MPTIARHVALTIAALAALACSSPRTSGLHAGSSGTDAHGPAAEVQGQGVPLEAVITLRDGSRIVGRPLATEFTLKSAYGPLSFRLEAVASIAFTDSAGGVSVEFQNGDLIRGTLAADALPVEFAAGKMVFPVAAILHIAPSTPGGRLAGGLVAHYPLHGNATDVSGHGHDGVNFGALPAQDRFGIQGHACEFNGTNAHINLPEGLVDPEGPACSFSLWVLTRSANTAREALYIGAATAEFTIDVRDGNFLFATELTDHKMYPVTWPAVENAFVHLACVYVRGKSVRLYVNGELKAESPVPNLAVNAGLADYSSGIGSYAPLHPELGRRFGMSNWDGRISDVRIYSRPLSDEEIRSLARMSD